MNYDKKVGIMGGTFNPIHLGHLILAENACEELELDEVLFIPTGNSYMKNPADILDSKTRITMTGEAIEDNPHFALSTMEVDRDHESYTFETIAELKAHNPTTEYFLIIGADSLFDMETWAHPELIFTEIKMAVAVRDIFQIEKLKEQIKYLEGKYGAVINILSCRNVDISSTKIRERVRQGKSIRYMVRYKTESYIKRHAIYQEKE